MIRAAFQLRRFLASGVLGVLLFAGLFSFTLSKAHAASAPNILNYQGRLLNANGVPISAASASISFALYTTLASGGPGDPECVWTNSSMAGASAVARTVTLTDGLFSENLGDTAAGTPYAAIADAVFANNASLYLEITINGEMLSPRKQIVSAPYAMNSDSIDGFDSTQVGATSAAVPVFDNSGNLKLTGNPTGSTVADGSLFIDPASGDVSANDVLFGIAVTNASKFSIDAEGDTTVVGDLAVSGGDLTTSSSTFNLLVGNATLVSFASDATTLNIDNAPGGSTKTINIGGTTASSPDAINIATQGTLADTIIIGNTNASTLLALTGGDDWSIDNAGLITTAGNVAVNGGSITSTAALSISSSTGNVSLSPSGGGGSGVAYVTAGDSFAVGAASTVAPFSVIETINTVRIGDGASDANDPTLTMYASDATNSGSLSYLDTDAFNFAGGNLVHTPTAAAAGTIGQLFTDDAVTSGIGMRISRGAGGSDFTGTLLNIAQNNVSATSTGDVVFIANKSAGASTSFYIDQAVVTEITNGAGGTAKGGQAIYIDIDEAGSTRDAITMRAQGQITFDVQSDGSVLSDGSYSSTGADYAEYFATNDSSLGNNLIACQDTALRNGVQRCGLGATAIVGIVSPTPGFIGNMPNMGEALGTAIVGLNGQIDTLVDNSGGVINIGDPITASSTTSGYGAKAIGAGRIVGYALEPLASSTGTIRILVQPQWFGGEVIADNSVSGLTNTSLLDVDGSLNMNGGRILAISSLQGLGGNWHLAENGDFTTHGQFIGLVTGYSGAPVETYSTMSRQHLIQLSGTSTFQNGLAHILFADVDPQFADIISNTSPYRVIATPSGLTGQIYVSERDLTGFTIRDVNNSSGVQVDWLVMAYNKDFAPVSATTEPIVVPAVIEPVGSPSSAEPAIEPSADIVVPTSEPVITEPLVEAPVVAEDPVTAPDPVVDAPIIAEPAVITEPSQSSALAANPPSELSSPAAP